MYQDKKEKEMVSRFERESIVREQKEEVGKKGSLKRRFTLQIAQWLQNQLQKICVADKDSDLLGALGTWIQIEKGRNNELVIGFVRCRECGTEWEALAYGNTVHKLECPTCAKKNSVVVGATC